MPPALHDADHVADLATVDGPEALIAAVNRERGVIYRGSAQGGEAEW
ncbi:hypothetical protein [Microbacterium sp. SA39]|nr:hypothetical protein [Microbacterium sp. SA39]